MQGLDRCVTSINQPMGSSGSREVPSTHRNYVSFWLMEKESECGWARAIPGTTGWSLVMRKGA